ncbi:MAG: DegT/DnrJ/EryC1/StrS family aminotransferase [Deltaproteobacteria bacterium]|nr:DegT/DnrJ/EryC1/StrS family aminotransferase [Deltaproteobacteria bacterium]
MPYIDESELDFIGKSVRDKWLTEGPYAKLFLESIKDYTGSEYAVLAPNGTLGLFLALLALDLPRGSEIIIPSFTFFASASSAVFAGLTPVFVDVEEDTYNIDVSKIEELITDKTKGIMPVHVYGHSCKIDKLMKLAEKYQLKVIEDAAQGFGVFLNNRHVGTFGDVSMLSFFADKTITTGEGAVVLTKDERLYNKLVLLRNQGRPHSGTFIHPSLGMNFRMTDIQCAIGVAQYKKFPDILKKRLEDFEFYREGLEGVGDLRFIRIQEGSTFVPFRFFIRTKYKKELLNFLEKNGVQTRSFFYPMHLQPALECFSNKRSLPVSEELYETGICLPLHFYMSKEDILFIIEKVKSLFKDV